MDSASWCSQSSSSASSSPSPTLVDNLRLYNDEAVEIPDNHGTRDVFKDVVKGRKSWKTLKGGEMVWPPELEAALLEGLASYQPDDSRETRLLGRFPMRNRYISAYIYQKTGKHRTAKQVGSRLQQLRDTCGTKKLQHLLSPCRRQISPSAKKHHYGSLQRYGLSTSSHCDSGSSSDTSAPTSPISDSDLTWRELPMLYINILPHTQSISSTNARGSIDSNESSIESIGGTQPRSIRTIDPTLTFVSRCLLNRSTVRSMFEVYDCHNALVHREECALTDKVSSGNEEAEGSYLYSTPLVPNFWESICNHMDPTEYTIKHEVFQDGLPGPCMFSAIYKFRYFSEASSHRRRPIPASSPLFDMKTPHHPNVNHNYSYDCTAPDNAFDVNSLSEIGYTTGNELLFEAAGCYQNTGERISVPSTPTSETDYSRSGSNSLSPTSAWFYPETSRINYH